MNTFLYGILNIIARAHTYILSLNDAYETYFTDKELHFIVIGAIGMIMVFLIHPLFTLLAKTDHVLVITWIYVFTLVLLITFAIEIGQKVSHSGVMDFKDIVFGIWGFMLMFLIFALIRGIIIGIIHLIKDR
ncbi:hypothetical protein SAMN02910298_02015 [Pseudobutyrivibrio sp. YE44]|uniref:hypothetical protein n=1 Tax=Pseudobutyrivibrio sp. YE44 TaxID=1520802 RepID=UPI0008880AA7|nr:hypothetical protein [Pseudobutyrivibrio sp. YE44]SDB40867.1 hypothetical protein SAMN02910298_02015 [Pseudobutyrivibrio sp. YE44]